MTNLKRIIDEKGVQQRWLAEQVGVTEVSMSRYVSGDRIPKAPMAIRMADALGVDVKELYGWDDEHVVGESEQPETHEERAKTHGVCLDTIDRKAALDWLKNEWNGMVTSLFDGIKALPSAESEIIRCKDCAHWMPHCQLGFDIDNEEYHDYCGRLIPEDEYYAFYRNADDYCSRAERRTDG